MARPTGWYLYEGRKRYELWLLEEDATMNQWDGAVFVRGKDSFQWMDALPYVNLVPAKKRQNGS